MVHKTLKSMSDIPPHPFSFFFKNLQLGTLSYKFIFKLGQGKQMAIKRTTFEFDCIRWNNVLHHNWRKTKSITLDATNPTKTR
jgi:hypothetical protein